MMSRGKGKIGKHDPETVWVLTSREPGRMNAQQWLQAQRDCRLRQIRGLRSAPGDGVLAHVKVGSRGKSLR
jgi:hypothetical protein